MNLDLIIAPLDPTDAASVDAVLDLCNTARKLDIPGFQPICPHRFRAGLTYAPAHQRSEHLVARHAGEAVGYLALALPQQNNLDNATLELVVHPAHRRRGIGTQLYRWAQQRLRQLGRKRLIGLTVAPLAGPAGRNRPAEPTGPGSGFAAALGATAALTDLRSLLDLADPAGEHARAELAQLVDRASADYRLVTWRDRTPPELLSDAAYLAGRVGTDAPSGELAREPDRVDLARVRQNEDGLTASRTHTYLAGAVHRASGRMVGLTMLARQHTVRDHGSQWITIVDPDHRGHRLGWFVKLGNLQHIRTHEPELRLISTWNAESNHHMIRINRAMGFRPVDQWINWQAEW